MPCSDTTLTISIFFTLFLLVLFCGDTDDVCVSHMLEVWFHIAAIYQGFICQQFRNIHLIGNFSHAYIFILETQKSSSKSGRVSLHD